MTIQTGANGMEMWQASLGYLANPSQENKDRLDAIHEKIQREHKLRKFVQEDKFIKKHGEEMLGFIKSISNDVLPDSFYWEVNSDDNDDYWLVKFYEEDGKFYYIKQIFGGYAGTEFLEEDISKERVLELLNKTK